MNQHISLSPDSQVRIDAINTIKYTFLLDYNPPEYIITQPQQQVGTTKFNSDNTVKDGKNFLQNVFFNCLQCCDSLFNFHFPEYSKWPSSFFGICYYSEPFEFFSSFTGSVYYTGSIYKDIDTYTIKLPTLQNLILQHCVISCYHVMITEKNKGNYYTPYQMVKPQNTPGNKSTSAAASNFNSKTTSHLKDIPIIFSFIEYTEPLTAYRFPKVLVPCWKDICEIPSPVFRTIYSQSHTPKKRFDNILKVRENWSLSSEKSIEGLHKHYLFERFFHFDLFYYAYLMAYAFTNLLNKEYCQKFGFLQSISDMINRNKYLIISALRSISDLPNTFSRQYFLLYALCSINELTNSASDFWHNQAVNYNLKPPKFEISTWIGQFNRFIRYLSNIVIPVFEWCFIGMLLEGIEKAFPSETHENHLERGITILSHFIEQNYELYRDPMSVLKNPSIQIDNLFTNITGTTLPTSGNYYKELIQNDILVPLLNSFYSPEILELSSDGCFNPSAFPKQVNLNITDRFCPEQMSYLRPDIIDLIK